MPLNAPIRQRLHTLGVDDKHLRPFFCPPRQASLVLRFENDALVLADTVTGQTLAVDFLSGQWRRRAAGHLRGELVVKAVFGRHKPGDGSFQVLDATAGLGRDSLLLAAAGARVIACERHPLIHALLADGLWRAAADERLRPVIERIRLHQGDFRQMPKEPVDVVYLDPMFPPRDKSAKVKKDMQLLHRLLGAGQDDADTLLTAAGHWPAAKVVVKRPRLAAPLAGQSPTSQLMGKTSRFDVYAITKT